MPPGMASPVLSHIHCPLHLLTHHLTHSSSASQCPLGRWLWDSSAPVLAPQGHVFAHLSPTPYTQLEQEGVCVGVKGPETTFHEWTHTREKQNGAGGCPPIREPHSFLLWSLMELEGQSYFPSRNCLYRASDSWKIRK